MKRETKEDIIGGTLLSLCSVSCFASGAMLLHDLFTGHVQRGAFLFPVLPFVRGCVLLLSGVFLLALGIGALSSSRDRR